MVNIASPILLAAVASAAAIEAAAHPNYAGVMSFTNLCKEDIHVLGPNGKNIGTIKPNDILAQTLSKRPKEITSYQFTTKGAEGALQLSYRYVANDAPFNFQAQAALFTVLDHPLKDEKFSVKISSNSLCEGGSATAIAQGLSVGVGTGCGKGTSVYNAITVFCDPNGYRLDSDSTKAPGFPMELEKVKGAYSDKNKQVEYIF